MELGWSTTAGESGPLYWEPVSMHVQLLWPEHVQRIISSIFAIWQETAVPWKVTDVAIKFAERFAQLRASQLQAPDASLESREGGAGLCIGQRTFKWKTRAPTSAQESPGLARIRAGVFGAEMCMGALPAGTPSCQRLLSLHGCSWFSAPSAVSTIHQEAQAPALAPQVPQVGFC